MKTFLTTLAFLFFVTLTFESKAQGDQKFLTFSGFVIDANTEEPIVGAFVINHRAGKGVQTNAKGYFILDVFPSDSIVFSFMGFKPQYHIIPKNTGLSYSAVVELNVDAKVLRAVKVYPFRTEEEFKYAFLNMDAPNAEEREIIERNLGRESIRALAMNSPMTSMGNYRYAIEQQLNHQQNQKFTTLNPLLNAGSWISFIRNVKDGTAFKGFGSGGNSGTPIEKNNNREELLKASKNAN